MKRILIPTLISVLLSSCIVVLEMPGKSGVNPVITTPDEYYPLTIPPEVVKPLLQYPNGIFSVDTNGGIPIPVDTAIIRLDSGYIEYFNIDTIICLTKEMTKEVPVITMADGNDIKTIKEFSRLGICPLLKSFVTITNPGNYRFNLFDS